MKYAGGCVRVPIVRVRAQLWQVVRGHSKVTRTQTRIVFPVRTESISYQGNLSAAFLVRTLMLVLVHLNSRGCCQDGYF